MAQHARGIQTPMRSGAYSGQIHNILNNTYGATFTAACAEAACSVEIAGHAVGAPGGWVGAEARGARRAGGIWRQCSSKPANAFPAPLRHPAGTGQARPYPELHSCVGWRLAGLDYGAPLIATPENQLQNSR
jgi:hypothetical protein